MNIKLFQMILTAMLVSAPATTGIAAGVIGEEVLAPDSVEAKQKGDGPRLQFLDGKTLDLGVFEADSVQHGVLRFVNAGNEPLVIKTVFSDCGCTVPEFSREPVRPGDEGEITVRFNGKGRPHGSFKKIVRVRSNALNSLAVAFVKGRIARPVRRK